VAGDLIDLLMLLAHPSGLTRSLPFTRTFGLPIHVAPRPAAPFPSMSWLASPFHSRQMAMQPVTTEFLAETGRQIAFLSAFLGGFAATFLGILLQSPSSRRHVGWAAGAAAVASASFILAVISGTLFAVVLHPGAPPGIAKPTFLPQVRILILVTLAFGIYSILLSLGLSGWIRSRQLGIVTSVAALISAVIVSLLVRW
jgi:hypothetical protein